MDDESLEEIAKQLMPLPDAVYRDALLSYFTREIEAMDLKTLRALRAQCELRSEGTTIEDTMLQVLDGQIALRQLGLE